ncbi:hypothetical protein, partial [Bacillus mycoides]|uniref:hypothetical protein n=1 Tax=Bacillus mycoides TaxID=1405 RepID=UPI003D0163B2
YSSNNNGSYSSNGYSSNNNESYPSNGYSSNNNGSYSSNGYSLNNNESYLSNGYNSNYNGYGTGYEEDIPKLGDDLPQESKSFNKIINKLQNYSNNKNIHVLNALISDPNRDLTNAGACARTVRNSNAVLNEKIELNSETQPFIFYKMDNGNFIIGNEGNGNVLKMIDDEEDDKIIVSSMYSPNIETQIFKKYFVNGDVNTFRLQTTMNGINWEVNNCHNRSDLQQRITAVPQNRGYQGDREYQFKNVSNIIFPDMVMNPQQLPDPRQLNSINDTGDVQRAIQGKSLIPGIIVNDVTLSKDEQIKQSPYYILEYAQTWEPMFNQIVSSFEQFTWREYSGITLHDQLNMQNIVNMSIGGTVLGWGLRFGNKSDLFIRTILSGLTIAQSFASDMGISEEYKNDVNTTNVSTRFIKYIKTHELILRRLDRLNDSIAKWKIYDNREFVTRKYPISQI